ncbi:hypothetical protein NDS46_13720 [Paenibacillus thiaminolyticus]|uniref:hypothetical protein n=1 Tax=Paenibacillus thiaminolyticus TaxID=49283 RepID=UPI00232E84A9|nr:hypothetical protein [Paenibacillus thiaminolyticus]WCF10833.1 hypothetical protein NDS46_13720 [Paenibacillus thiaminolyticus]
MGIPLLADGKWVGEGGQWIAFIAVPTASMPADGNTLCLLSAEGRASQRRSWTGDPSDEVIGCPGMIPDAKQGNNMKKAADLI